MLDAKQEELIMRTQNNKKKSHLFKDYEKMIEI